MTNNISKWYNDNVVQCWTCKNCVGKNIYYNRQYKQNFYLPECLVMNQYMTYINNRLCENYLCKGK